jgi:hypothetical protein
VKNGVFWFAVFLMYGKYLLAVLGICALAFLLVGCNSPSRGDEPCTTLTCLKAEQQHQQYLYCMGSDPDRRRTGRVRTYPGGESWADYCRSITR